MGIFSADREEDTQAIINVLASSVFSYNSNRQSDEAYKEFPEIELCPTFETVVSTIREMGCQILKRYENPSAYDRLATLLILTNSVSPFSLRKNGRPIMNFPARHEFLSVFTCLLIHTGASVFILTDEQGNDYKMKWVGFPNNASKQNFITYLAWTPGVIECPTSTGKNAQMLDPMQTLAQLALGCSLLLPFCIEKDVPAQPPLLGE